MNKVKLTLVAVFVTSLMTAQIVSSKLLAVSLPLIGTVAMPGGTLAYAFTFLSTDAINELYGKEEAADVVNVAFLMNFVLLGLLYSVIWWPAAGGVPAETFAAALAPSVNIVAGSLVAYLLSQHIDVRLFAKLRSVTSERYLWLRNIGSTAVSQVIDTILFTVVAFLIAPAVGIGPVLPLTVIASLIIGQSVVKALIAVIDTPLIYLTVRIVRNYNKPKGSVAA
jgi:uncharacterized integral membrane protein (TIGR00697 family)